MRNGALAYGGNREDMEIFFSEMGYRNLTFMDAADYYIEVCHGKVPRTTAEGWTVQDDDSNIGSHEVQGDEVDDGPERKLAERWLLVAKWSQEQEARVLKDIEKGAGLNAELKAGRLLTLRMLLSAAVLDHLPGNRLAQQNVGMSYGSSLMGIIDAAVQQVALASKTRFTKVVEYHHWLNPSPKEPEVTAGLAEASVASNKSLEEMSDPGGASSAPTEPYDQSAPSAGDGEDTPVSEYLMQMRAAKPQKKDMWDERYRHMLSHTLGVDVWFKASARATQRLERAQQTQIGRLWERLRLLALSMSNGHQHRMTRSVELRSALPNAAGIGAYGISSAIAPTYADIIYEIEHWELPKQMPRKWGLRLGTEMVPTLSFIHAIGRFAIAPAIAVADVTRAVVESARQRVVKRSLGKEEGGAHRLVAAAHQDAQDDLSPFYYLVPATAVLSCSEPTLPRWQELQQRGTLVRKRIDLISAYHENIDDILFVSHRWEEPMAPDSHGEQLKQIRDHLRLHAQLKYVWYDFWCMPQKNIKDNRIIDDRTNDEKAEFGLMLQGIADLYLTTRVLIILDITYMGRFWTTLEAWCAMQKATYHGLRPATNEEKRYEIVCVHNATEGMGKELVKMLADKSPVELVMKLARPDCVVTNHKDKEKMLPKVADTNDRVKEMFGKMYTKINASGVEAVLEA